MLSHTTPPLHTHTRTQVCDDYWDQNDAETACRSLGFPGAAPNGAMTNAFFGQGTGAILLDDVQCGTNGPANLFLCSHNPVGTQCPVFFVS